MIKTNIFGDKFLFERTKERYIDAKNDIYPPPLMTKIPSRQVFKYDRLWFAIIYFQLDRIRELIRECQTKECDFSIFDKDYYKLNVITLICQTNHPTNMPYRYNVELFERVFMTTLENIHPDNLKILMEDLFNSLIFDKQQIAVIIENLNDREWMLIALWNYGLKYRDEHLELVENIKIKSIMTENIDKPFITRERYLLLNRKCPITRRQIRMPAILNGTVYEYSIIKGYIRKNINNFRDPMTNMNIKPVLYLPEKNTFKHF